MQPSFAPQDRVFHDAMRYVVETVSPDGTTIRTVSGHNLPVTEVVPEADMAPVTTEDLAEGWWRYTYEGRTYTAATLPFALARVHPTAMLRVVIVDQDDQLVGRAFGRPHESAIIWADSHPDVPHPHVAEWLGNSPWPQYTDAERAHLTAGPPAHPTTVQTPADQPAPAREPVTAQRPDTREAAQSPAPAAEAQPPSPAEEPPRLMTP